MDEEQQKTHRKYADLLAQTVSAFLNELRSMMPTPITFTIVGREDSTGKVVLLVSQEQSRAEIHSALALAAGMDQRVEEHPPTVITSPNYKPDPKVH